MCFVAVRLGLLNQDSSCSDPKTCHYQRRANHYFF